MNPVVEPVEPLVPPAAAEAPASQPANLIGLKPSHITQDVIKSLTSTTTRKVVTGAVATAAAICLVVGALGLGHQIGSPLGLNIVLILPATAALGFALRCVLKDYFKNKSNETKLEDIKQNLITSTKRFENNKASWSEIQKPQDRTRPLVATGATFDDTKTVRELKAYKAMLDSQAKPLAALLHSELEDGASAEAKALRFNELLAALPEEARQLTAHLRTTVAYALIDLKLNALPVQLFGKDDSGAIVALETPFTSEVVAQVLAEVQQVTGLSGGIPTTVEGTSLTVEALIAKILADKATGSFGQKLRTAVQKATAALNTLADTRTVSTEVSAELNRQKDLIPALQHEIREALTQFKAILARRQGDAEVLRLQRAIAERGAGRRDITSLSELTNQLQARLAQLETENIEQFAQTVHEKSTQLQRILDFVENASPARDRVLARIPQAGIIVQGLNEARNILGDVVTDQALAAATNLTERIDRDFPAAGTPQEQADKIRFLNTVTEQKKLLAEVHAFGLDASSNINDDLDITAAEAQTAEAIARDLRAIGSEIGRLVEQYVSEGALVGARSPEQNAAVNAFYQGLCADFRGVGVPHGRAFQHSLSGEWISDDAQREVFVSHINTLLGA